MASLFDFLKNKGSKLVIAIDVGSYSIKTAVFEINANSKQISSINKKIFSLPITVPENGLENSKVTTSRIREIIFNYLKELKRVPYKVVIGFDGPLAESAIITFKIQNPKSGQKISKKELDDLFLSLINEENKKLASEGKIIILARPISIFINGYEIKDLDESFPAEEIEFKTFVLTLDSQKTSDFMIIPKMLGGIPIEFSSVIYNIGCAVAEKMPDGKECFILDIGGLYTNLIVVKNGVISEVAGFPSGGYNFTKSLAIETGIEIGESFQLKKQYIEGITTKPEMKKISSVFTSESVAWEEKFINALEGISSNDFFPKTFYIVGGGANIPEIRNVLEAKKWASHILSAGEISISTIKAEDILGKSRFNAALKGAEETGLASLIINSI